MPVEVSSSNSDVNDVDDDEAAASDPGVVKYSFIAKKLTTDRLTVGKWRSWARQLLTTVSSAV
jgi:hypothetical protein